jgi:hypothetical protein
MYQVPTAADRDQGSMAPSAIDFVRSGMTSEGIDLHFEAEPGALCTGAVGAVEAEGARFDLADRGAVVGAGEVFGEDPLGLVAAVEGDLHDAGANLERGLDGIGDAAGGGVIGPGLGHDQAIDDDIDVVALVLVERDGLVEVADFAVDADADEASLARLFEDADVLPLLRAGERRQQGGGGSPAGRRGSASTICWTVWRSMGRPHLGQCGVPTRAQSRRM